VVRVASTDTNHQQFSHRSSLVHVRLLLLGGTGEARALAAALAVTDVAVVSSLAGRVSNPALPLGEVRVGGFGGADGLADYLRAEGIDAVLDATHPFAASITANAAAATSSTGTPLLVLRRPGWAPEPNWTLVAEITAAAAHAASSGPGTILLTTGRRDLASFAADACHRYVARAVDPPTTAMPPQTTVLLARGPYTLEGELALMREHAVTLLVTKDSGGTMTAAKLDAARELDVPVVVVQRPPRPPGVRVVETVEAALAWISPGSAAA
jgi:precorrin-6A/cobalt-precorrin-6A reductase